MLLLVYGNDAYRVQKKRQELTAHFREKFDVNGWNIHRVNAEKVDEWPSVASACLKNDLFGSRRFVVVSGLLGAITRKEDAQTWAERFLRLGEKTIVVLEEIIEEEDIEKNKFIPLVRGQSGVHSYLCHRLNGNELESWIALQGKEQGSAWTIQATRRLIQCVGNDSWRLITAIQTISAGAGDEVVSNDVDTYVAEPIPDMIFAFVDAMRLGKAEQASKALATELTRGTEAMQLLTMCARDVQTLARVWADVQRGKESNPAEIGAHPFVVKKLTPLARSMKEVDIQRCVERVLRADERVKTGLASPERALEECVLGT